ncbi:tripartite tricarboxylate transporter TctB family protein [Kushneria phosphatilytica]|uniref:Tripartite tricarboxylate transporter TctB family protein n=1 Tax=Kushneria phosphatilytica TaxID=657387 RepID=A0A1S1NTB0_9GAMM|nr:tripartite tricarboxylate transporter TctB family protein [Kushneria phosphatilytica]OHV08825.1 hypothetical protein BH688_12500 [Kushneria phosphatilytica]QEL12545.1 tripartite tricarboxylate transporter TctB family protein [Kushneria phosphatilytica]
MRIDDRLSGTMLILLGALIFWRASTFPALAGLAYGSGLFPSIAAVGLMISGAAIALTAQLRQRALAGVGASSEGSTTRGTWRHSARVVALLAVVLGYGLLLDPLGFHLTSMLAVAATAMIFGLSVLRSLMLAIPLVIAVHLLFYSLMHVPLPWGVLTPIAW